MAGRKPGFRHNEEVRARIKASQIINRLEEHVMASQPLLDASQVNAAKALLNKVLPDLSSVQLEHSGSISTRPDKMTDEELENIAASQATTEERTLN